MCYRSITMAIDKDGDELILGGRKKRKGDDDFEMKRAAEKEARRQAEIGWRKAYLFERSK